MRRSIVFIVAMMVLASGRRGSPLAEISAAPQTPAAGRGASVTAASAGTVRIGVRRGASYDVVQVPLEEYVARVLAGEALPGSAPGAMEALAIAVRTYTAANLGRHRSEGFDLCDETHCQVMRTASATTTRAAQATAGQVLLYRGAPANIYYSASCGGQTEVPSAVWPGADDPPYLPSQPDDGCRGLPAWTAELAMPDLQRAFAASGYRGSLRDMKVASRDGSGRVAVLTVDGLTPDRLSGQDLRAVVGQTLGWQYVRSAVFDMRRSGDTFRLDGRGSGHGVGMCVIGSANLAAAGQSAKTILQHYYPGLVIGSFPGVSAPALTMAQPAAPRGPAGISVTVPGDRTAERDALAELTAQARDTLAIVLGVTPPPALVVHVHATTAEYERATGRAWFTTGAVINGEIHIPPIAEQGSLERAVRRQVVHRLIDAELAKRPAWVREGAALHFADDQVGPVEAPARVTCPSDSDLARPVSAGAFGVALADARACFEKQTAAGRAWRDIR